MLIYNVSGQEKTKTQYNQRILNKTNINRVFRRSKNKQEVICPPNQVFTKTDFDFLFTIGGGLVEDKDEFKKFIEFLKTIKETEFYISENIGATLTERNKPFHTTIDLKETYEIFQEKVKSFEPPFGWTINHFYIYGENENWGIYMCEYPTVNIIGCDKKLSDEFRQVFSIKGNGYRNLKEFITQEYQTKSNLITEFEKQYNVGT